uniref:Uncharacterized protein n=1 Tax=Rhizophora mucronata TaxID=61149 RepID=A0A2P2M658_RHIMU
MLDRNTVRWINHFQYEQVSFIPPRYPQFIIQICNFQFTTSSPRSLHWYLHTTINNIIFHELSPPHFFIHAPNYTVVIMRKLDFTSRVKTL